MPFFDRIRNIIISPQKEWQVINGENETASSLLYKYVLPLLLIGAAAAFIGYGFIGIDTFFFKIRGLKWGAWFALRHLISGVAGYFIATYVIDALAQGFSAEKNTGKSAQLVAYASTPSWLAAIFMILPSLGLIGLLGLYGIYLFYIGLPVLKKVPEDKSLLYMIASVLITIVVYAAVQWIMELILNPILGDPYENSLNELKNIFTQ